MSQDFSYVLIADEDHDIIKHVLNDSVNTYSLLIAKYQTPVYNLFLRMLHDSSEAKELTPAYFVKAYESVSCSASKKTSFQLLPGKNTRSSGYNLPCRKAKPICINSKTNFFD